MLPKDYEPEELVFVLPDAVKELFPLTLEFSNVENDSDILKQVSEHFNAVYPDREIATRYMDDVEKQDIRDIYCKLVEEDLPKAEANLLDAKEEAKRIKTNAEDLLNAVQKQIADYAAKVHEGTEEKKLPATKTFRFALAGWYVTYAIINRVPTLVKASQISDYDKSSLWSQEDRNRIAMNELFGLEYAAPERPTDEELDETHDLGGEEIGDEDDFDNIV